MKIISKLWLGVGILVLLSPLGWLIPAHFKAGSAWGEWGPEELKDSIGYVPSGMEHLSRIWKAPIADYSFGSILSAIVGISAIVIAVLLIGKVLAKKGG